MNLPEGTTDAKVKEVFGAHGARARAPSAECRTLRLPLNCPAAAPFRAECATGSRTGRFLTRPGACTVNSVAAFNDTVPKTARASVAFESHDDVSA